MLAVRELDACHGKVQALWGVSLNVRQREIVSLIGANGAGKTTLVDVRCGNLRPASGAASFRGRSLLGLGPHAIAELGIAHVPEGGGVFPDMGVRENLEMGAYCPSTWPRRKGLLEEVYRLFPPLKEREKQLARCLSGGEKQMLAMGRCLMADPQLCLLDEPSYGLAPIMVQELFRIICCLRERGITILLIEQNVHQALRVADRAYVMENGRIVGEGSSSELLADGHIRKAYLGL